MIFSPNHCCFQKRVAFWLPFVAMMLVLSALAVLGHGGLGHRADRPGSVAAKSPDSDAQPLDPSDDRIAPGDGSATASPQTRQFDPDPAVFPAFERFEKRVAESVGRARESVVTLEYTSAYPTRFAPHGYRRGYQ